MQAYPCWSLILFLTQPIGSPTGLTIGYRYALPQNYSFDFIIYLYRTCCYLRLATPLLGDPRGTDRYRVTSPVRKNYNTHNQYSI